MANLTYAQLEGQWIQAGGSTALAPLMAAIAEAESGGNPQATNPHDNNGTQTSWGLWQISNGTHTAPSPNWNNPLVNAQLAVAKYNSQGLGAWGTYVTGAYKPYLSNSTSPDTSPLTGDAALTAATAAAGAPTGTDSNCAWGIGFGGIPGGSFLAGIFGTTGLGTSISSGEVCIVSKPQVRGLVGVGLLGLGLLIIVNGLSIIAVKAALPIAEDLLGFKIGTKMLGKSLRGSSGSASSAPAPSPPPPTYSGGSASGSTPPPAPARQNRPPVRRASPVSRTRSGGRTQQGRQRVGP